MSKLTVIIPVYNEEKTIAELIRRVLAAEIPIEKEVIVVNDNSTDRTEELALSFLPKIKYIKHERNLGRGAGCKTGLAEATGDIVIFQDGDLEYDPEDFKVMIEPILKGEADCVLGSRVLSHSMEHAKLWRQPVSFFSLFFITTFINVLYGARFRDYSGCYKAYKKEILMKLGVKTDRFEYEYEAICLLLKNGYKIREVPISYHPRTLAEGKKISWTDGLPALWSIVKTRFS